MKIVSLPWGSRHLVEQRDPVPHRRAGRPIDIRMGAIEEQVAHVDDVGLLEVIDGVAAGVPGAVVAPLDGLVAEARLPLIREGRVGK